VRLFDVSSLAVPLFIAGKVPGIRLQELSLLVGRPKKDPCSAADIVELTRDVFEKMVVLYYGALK
jgi:hypothetical protein